MPIIDGVPFGRPENQVLTAAFVAFIEQKRGASVTRNYAPGVTDFERDDEQVQSRLDSLVAAFKEVGEGSRNDSLFRLAAKGRDIGASKQAVMGVVLRANHEKCSPPMPDDEVAIIVGSAYTNAQNPQGIDAPENVFKAVEVPASEKKPELKLDLHMATEPDPARIPPRDWILGRHLLGTKVSVLIAPPGAGKSTFTLAMALAIVTQTEKILNTSVYQRCNVLAINNEDDDDELSRRLAGLLQFHGIPWTEVAGKLHTYSGVDNPFIIAQRTPQETVVSVHKKLLIEYILKHHIKVLIIDPFLETHRVSENSNEEINQVARMYRQVATTTGCAVLLVHHTRKPAAGASMGHSGNMDSGRGASSLMGVARVVMTLFTMSDQDAKRYNIPKTQAHLYVRLDDAKANLSLASQKAKWFKKCSVTLVNTDEVGVLEPVELQEVEEATNDSMLEAMQEILAENNGEMPASALSGRLVETAVCRGESKTTVTRRVKKILAERVEVNGWELWYGEDTGPQAKGVKKHMVYGRVVVDSS